MEEDSTTKATLSGKTLPELHTRMHTDKNYGVTSLATASLEEKSITTFAKSQTTLSSEISPPRWIPDGIMISSFPEHTNTFLKEAVIIIQSRTVLISAFIFMIAGFLSQLAIRLVKLNSKKCLIGREHKYI